MTVNGARAAGAWYWERPYADQPVQAHYRLAKYWPANATVRVGLPIGGLPAGKGLVYAAGLTSVTFRTGDAHVSRVDGATERMTVTSNGDVVKTVPVSLGAYATPTYTGTKIVMQKGEQAPGSSSLRPDGGVRMGKAIVDWSVRLSATGEYVHDAYWNPGIGRTSTSHGCTNLKPDDAKWFYGFALLGDVVTFTGTGGTAMRATDGLGDWNVPWATWSQGGMLAA